MDRANRLIWRDAEWWVLAGDDEGAFAGIRIGAVLHPAVFLAFADCARLEQNGIHVQGPSGESDSGCSPALASDRFQALILRMVARDYTTTPPQPLVCPSCNKVGIVDVSTADNPYAKSDDFRVERLPEGFAVRARRRAGGWPKTISNPGVRICGAFPGSTANMSPAWKMCSTSMPKRPIQSGRWSASTRARSS
jgi:hypothetical protein